MCTTTNKDYFVASVYHPPTFDYFIDYLVNSCESIVASLPNARLIIAGDINKLDLKSLTQQSGLSCNRELPSLLKESVESD